jgi:hypothetical protein
MKTDDYKKTIQTKEVPKNRTSLWNKSTSSKRLTNQYQKRGIKDLMNTVDDKSNFSYNQINNIKFTVTNSDLVDYVLVK